MWEKANPNNNIFSTWSISKIATKLKEKQRSETMGKIRKKAPKQKQKLAKVDRPRTLTKVGKIKRKKGDLKMIHSRNVAYYVKQRKGGKWVRTDGERHCKIHTVCDCVKRTDPTAMRFVHNR